jgi:hypothetical protein
VAPPGSKDSGAGTILGRKEGDDLAENSVREVADAVSPSSFILIHSHPLL